jgi:DNA-binding protein YbaB
MDTPLHLGMYAEYERLAEDVRTLQKRLADVRATAESDDGLVVATVGGAGELLELWLDPRVYRAPDSAALARTITGTIGEAVERSREEGVALAAAFLPPGATAGTTDLRFGPYLHELDRQAGR